MSKQRKPYTDTERKVLAYCTGHKMFQTGDKVVVGVSGGADSVCLLFVLHQLKEELGIDLVVVHVNHGIRKEAGEDARYVEKLCKDLEIPYYYREYPVRQKAMEEHVSEEEAGREVRYGAFGEILALEGAQKIAVAHNGNDRAETLLFHLFRGSGLTGLCAIRPVREKIVRPILCLKREEIEEYLQEKGIPFCTDATNETDAYTRNRIRHHILPYAEKEIVQGCVEHMLQAADILTETEDYIESETKRLYDRYVTVKAEQGKRYVDCNIVKEQPEFLQKRLILKLLKELAPGQKDIYYIHVEEVRKLLEENKNKSISLPYQMVATRSYQQLILQQGIEEEETAFSEIVISKEEWESLQKGEEIQISLGATGVAVLNLLKGNKGEIPQNPYTKWFDYDKIKKPLMFRTRKEGDVLSLRGQGTQQVIHKKLKEYMIHEKIPKQDREKIVLLAEEEQILWVIGYRMSEYYKVDKNTKSILQVKLQG